MATLEIVGNHCQVRSASTDCSIVVTGDNNCVWHDGPVLFRSGIDNVARRAIATSPPFLVPTTTKTDIVASHGPGGMSIIRNVTISSANLPGAGARIHLTHGDSFPAQLTQEPAGAVQFVHQLGGTEDRGSGRAKRKRERDGDSPEEKMPMAKRLGQYLQSVNQSVNQPGDSPEEKMPMAKRLGQYLQSVNQSANQSA